MKDKSIFSKIILLIVIFLVCVVTTIGMALIAGNIDTTLFDFKNLNFSNMLPVLIVGGFITCVIVGIAIITISRTVFFKVKDYLINENKGDDKK